MSLLPDIKHIPILFPRYFQHHILGNILQKGQEALPGGGAHRPLINPQFPHPAYEIGTWHLFSLEHLF